MTEFEILSALADSESFTDTAALLNRGNRSSVNRIDRRVSCLEKRGLLVRDPTAYTRVMLTPAGYDRLAELELMQDNNRKEDFRWFITTLISVSALIISLSH